MKVTKQCRTADRVYVLHIKLEAVLGIVLKFRPMEQAACTGHLC